MVRGQRCPHRCALSVQATSNAEYTSEAPIVPLSRCIACAARADERPRHFLNYGVKADSSAYWC